MLRGSAAGLASLAGCGAANRLAGTPDHESSTGTPGPLSVDWMTAPPMPVRRTQTTAVALDGRVYAIAGAVDDAEAGRVDAYDSDDAQWHEVASYPTGLNHASAVAHRGNIHTFGGYTGSFLDSSPLDDHRIYDPSVDRWHEGRPLPTPRGALVAVKAGGQIHTIGGRSPDGPSDVVEAYNPDTDTWSEGAPMPTPREHLAAGAIDGGVYVVGGRQGLSPMVAAAERYDPGRDEWERVTPMPTARAGIAGDTLAGRLFVFGGEEVGKQVFEVVGVYDPDADAWSAVEPLPTPRWGLGVATLGGAIHTIGGGTAPSAGITRRHDVLRLD